MPIRKQQLNVALTPDTFEQVRKMAERAQVSAAEIVRRAVDRHIELSKRERAKDAA